MKHDKILLGHGSGGKLSHDLITGLFLKYFGRHHNEFLGDSTILDSHGRDLAFSTDSFVVDPIFFPGGDIGKLAVCGTVNDIAVSGAKPLYLSASFILEEGLSSNDLERIIISMAEEAERSGVKIVTGDTKVVDKGKCDKIFINTTGIGFFSDGKRDYYSGNSIQPGDKVIINGPVGDHGMAVMASRKNLNFSASIKSDCASLNGLIQDVLDSSEGIRFMRDATRGGLATVLCEVCGGKEWGVELEEESLPLNEQVKGMCEILGFDPVYVANEGKVVIITEQNEGERVLEILRNHELGKEAKIIGQITEDHNGKVILNTAIGGRRIIDMLAGEQLPRIC
ncbi:hydrogenase expression/formation protein HypE [Bacteroidota bacterium]